MRDNEVGCGFDGVRLGKFGHVGVEVGAELLVGNLGSQVLFGQGGGELLRASGSEHREQVLTGQVQFRQGQPQVALSRDPSCAGTERGS